MLEASEILKGRILIVDDQEDNIMLLEQMLQNAGYQNITTTTDPSAVCAMHQAHRYDLILLDLQMPDMDGFQVMDGLHKIETTGYLPVLVITAQPAHKLRALQAGAKDFVSKPFDFAELRARVHNIIEVRLLHVETKRYSKVLEEAVSELEASREALRLKTLAELSLAQQTQESLLPQRLPQFESFEVRAFNSPTRYVGGDFYDFLQLSSGDWVGVLADVSGKGMSAALLSSMVLGALNMEFRAGTQPHEVLNRINRLLCEKSLPFQFVTLFLFVLNRDGIGEYISAGHNPAYLFRAGTGRIERLTSESFFLGMFDEAFYPARPLLLSKGDILVVYSDGLTDAESQNDQMFGTARLLEIIGREGPSGGSAIETSVLKAIDDFTNGEPQTDDITFVVVEKYR